MVTKREIAEAQRALNEAVAAMCVEIGGLRANAGSETWPQAYGVPSWLLKPVYDAHSVWDGLRCSLEGEGAAVARSTSIAAAKSRLMLKQSVRREILEMVVAHWNHYGVGMTADQILARLHGKHQTISARVSELVNTYELLVDTGQKRETSSKSKAIVWGPTSEAIAMVAAAVTGRTPDA